MVDPLVRDDALRDVYLLLPFKAPFERDRPSIFQLYDGGWIAEFESLMLRCCTWCGSGNEQRLGQWICSMHQVVVHI